MASYSLRHLLIAGVAATAVFAAIVWWFVVSRPQVIAVKATRGDAAEVVYATGVVEPQQWAKVSSLQRKRILEHCDCEGKAVKRGDVLARLEDGAERALLRELEARRERIQEEAQRLEGLVERNVTTRVTYDEKLTQLREQDARIAAQKDRINDLVLRAPMDGVVLRRDGEVGEIAGTSAADILFWVGQPKPLRVVAEVNEEDIIKTRLGMKVLLRHEGLPGEPLPATLAEITPKGDPSTKTFRVYFALPDDTPLRIGMSVEANIIVREVKGALLVPIEAVVNGNVFEIRRRPRAPDRGQDRHPRRADGRDPRLGSGMRSDRSPRRPRSRHLRDGARVRVQSASASAMRLMFSIALTHVLSRVRQSLVGMLGVATGVGFSVMMASLMEGSQRDFVDQLIDTMPHITVTDERRSPPVQPATLVYDAIAIYGLSTPVIRPGIKNPLAITSTLESWLPGAIAPSAVSKAIVRFAGRDIAANVTGIDPRREIKVSKLATQIRQGTLDDLYKASNAIILGDRLATKIGARVGNTVVLVVGHRPAHVVHRRRPAAHRHRPGRRNTDLYAAEDGADPGRPDRSRECDPHQGARHARCPHDRDARRDARPATRPCPGRRPTRICSRRSRSAISSCTRSSARSCWSPRSAPTISSRRSRTRRRATSRS